MLKQLMLTIYCFALYLFTTPAFAHSGHTSAPHVHSGLEFSLLTIVIVAILYRAIKK